jgi:two-component system sensor histidine kinase TctE
VVRSLCEEFRTLAGDREVKLVCDADDSIRVRGDAGQLGRLVQNLLSNAVKFSPAGGRVAVRLATVDGEAVLTVSDSGPGIPPEERSRVFDRFHRVREGRDEREGAGLGLSIVRWVARTHGGTVTVAGGSDGGARFEVRIPVVRLGGDADGSHSVQRSFTSRS